MENMPTSKSRLEELVSIFESISTGESQANLSNSSIGDAHAWLLWALEQC